MKDNMKKNIAILIIVIGLVFALHDHTLLAGEKVPENSAHNRIINELSRGNLTGVVGLYYEGVYFDKNSFIEDDKTVDLEDSNLIVPFFQIDYTTAAYSGFRIGAGLTGYSHIDDNSDSKDSIGDQDDIVTHQLYLGYELSQTSLKIGRMEFEESLLLSDYYEALNLVSEEIENVFLFLAVVDKVAESDIDKFIDFQNINRGDDSIDDYLFAVETTWDAVPDAIIPTLYYYHLGSLYDLYGTHIELFHETEEIGIGFYIDAYATNEDSRNGLRDANDEVHDSNIYHISPFIEVNDFTLAAGYINADHDVGAREGLIDDYFNPFNEGDKVYEPDARTWYGTLFYEAGSLSAGLVFGRTDYIDEQHRTEEEFDINADIKFLDNFRLKTEFSIVNSDSPEGDLKILEMALTYEF
jgi:hypothetical protein